MKQTKTLILAECAVMLGLSVALSFVKVWKMPMGGSVTLLSMLPLILISIKHGIKIGLPVTFLYACVQFGLDIGEVLTWGMTPGAITGMTMLDYLIPFTGLGLAGIFRKKSLRGWCAGIVLVMILRYISHVISGIIIFAQWAWEGWNLTLFSMAYNGWYMAPELALTMLGAILLLKTPHVQKMFTPVN